MVNGTLISSFLMRKEVGGKAPKKTRPLRDIQDLRSRWGGFGVSGRGGEPASRFRK